MKENIVKDKSYSFALRIIKLYKHLVEKKKEFVLSKQVLRCGTSIGANIEEAHMRNRQWVSDWVRLLRDSNYIDSTSAESLLNDCYELTKLTGKIISSSKQNLNN
jgi:hypothetical protein